MPRPRIRRRICFNPHIHHFRPMGIPIKTIQESILTREEAEAIRLIDYEKIAQAKAAKKMQISQPTLSRILKSAREKTADALINGKAIKIQGGDFKMAQPRGMGRGLRRGIGAGGRGMGGGFAAGPGGNCVCAKCKYTEPQVRGQPCMNKKCPKCGTLMTRE